MKYVYSVKINNSAVYYNFLEQKLLDNGYDVKNTYISDFTFCPWLIVYYDRGLKVINCNEGFYKNIKNNKDIIINESYSIKDFLDNLQLAVKSNITLF